MKVVATIRALQADHPGKGLCRGPFSTLPCTLDVGFPAVSVLLALKAAGLPQPAGALLFCPGVDLLRSPKTRPNTEAYLGAHPPDDPVVSPLTADLAGLPPMLVQVATGDEWCEDGKALVARAREHGVDARLELYPVGTHVFQVFWSFLPEAREALEQAGRFIDAIAAGRDAAAGFG